MNNAQLICLFGWMELEKHQSNTPNSLTHLMRTILKYHLLEAPSSSHATFGDCTKPFK